MDSFPAILIVDDSKFLRNYIHNSLKAKAYQYIVNAVDGKDAIDALMEHKIDLIISGLRMPKVNGIELLRALKNHSTLKHIPFVVLVSDLSDETLKEAMKIGAIDYLQKPFSPKDLDIKIKAVLNNGH